MRYVSIIINTDVSHNVLRSRDESKHVTEKPNGVTGIKSLSAFAAFCHLAWQTTFTAMLQCELLTTSQWK